MLQIHRTEDSRLRMSDGRRSGVAGGEAEARRTLYHWGYTDLSINKALAELRQAEGTLPPPTPWRVIRPTDRVHDTAADQDASPPASATAGKAPRKRRAKQAPDAPPAPQPPAKKRARGRKPSPDAESRPSPEAQAPPAPQPPAKKRARGRKPSPDAESRPSPEAQAPPAPQPPAKKRARGRKPSPDAESSPVAEAQAPDASGGNPDGSPEPATPGSRARRSRTRVAPPSASRDTTASGADPDPLARARALFAEGTRALRELEAATLPFARGPWTELRTQADHIVTCLTRKG